MDLYSVCCSELKDRLPLQTQDTVAILPNLLRGLEGNVVLLCRLNTHLGAGLDSWLSG